MGNITYSSFRETLINRTEPFPDESLESLLARSGKQNYYREKNWYEDLIKIPRGTHINYIYHDALFNELSKLLKLDIDVIKKLTVQRLIPFFYSKNEVDRLPCVKDNLLFTPTWEEAKSQLFLNGSNKVCPLCLNNTQYLLLPWLLKPITICPIHKVFLVEKCFKCGKNLKFKDGRCIYCRQDILELPTQKCDDDISNSLCIKILRTIDCYVPPDTKYVDVFDKINITPPQFFHYLWKMGQILFHYDPLNNYLRNIPLQYILQENQSLRQLSVFNLHWVLLASAETLTDFPNRLISCIDRLVKTENIKAGKKKFDHSFLNEIWIAFKQPEDWSWVWSPIIEYISRLTEKDRRVVALQSYTRKIANDLNQKTDDTNTSFHLQSASTVSDKNAKIDTLNQSLITLNELVAELKLSRKLVNNLISAGYISPIVSEFSDKRRIWYFRKTEIEKFIRLTLENIQILELQDNNTQRITYINDIYKKLNYAKISFVELFRDITRGSLPAYRTKHKIGLSSIWVYENQIPSWRNGIIQGRKSNFSIYEVMKKLGIGKNTLLHLKEDGLLLPVQGCIGGSIYQWEYREEDLHNFSQNFILSSEVAVILGISQRMVVAWSRVGWLPTVSKPTPGGSNFYWYKKVEIIDWKKDKITSSEAKALLGIKQRTLEDWIAKGVIKPLVGISQHPHWFSYSAVISLKESRELAATKK